MTLRTGPDVRPPGVLPARRPDQVIAEAASKKLRFAQALETLADLELDSPHGRAIERRFRMSPLHIPHSIDSFHFKAAGARVSHKRSSLITRPSRCYNRSVQGAIV